MRLRWIDVVCALLMGMIVTMWIGSMISLHKLDQIIELLK